MKVTIKPTLRIDLYSKVEEKRIDLRVRCQGRQTKLPTQYYARPCDWDKNKRRVKGTSAHAIATNRYLKNKESDFEAFVLMRTIEGTADRITLDEIRGLLNGEVVEVEAPKPDNATIEEIFDLYVDFLKTIDKRSNTIRNYGTNKRVICGFAKERYGRLVTIKNINLGFVRELRKYLKNDRKNGNGTIEKRLEGLRAAIRYAIHEGYAIDDPFNRYNNLIPSGSHKTVFLDADEYKRFRAMKLPANAIRSMRLSHKMFVFSCETGLRYSDMQDLKWEHLIENNGRYEALEKIQVKTGNHVHVPLSNQALAIIMLNGHNRAGEYVFDRIENQTINDCLKVLAADAGIAKNLTYHVSRHTFATNLANNGANEFEIAQLLGDKKLDMARIYVNNDAKGLKHTMNRVWNNMKKTS